MFTYQGKTNFLYNTRLFNFTFSYILIYAIYNTFANSRSPLYLHTPTQLPINRIRAKKKKKKKKKKKNHLFDCANRLIDGPIVWLCRVFFCPSLSRFYFPGGKPTPLSQVEATISRITAAFHSLPGHRASRSQFHTITKVCRASEQARTLPWEAKERRCHLVFFLRVCIPVDIYAVARLDSIGLENLITEVVFQSICREGETFFKLKEF